MMTTTITTTTNIINTTIDTIDDTIKNDTNDARLLEEAAVAVERAQQRRAIKRVRAAIEENVVEARRDVAALRRAFAPRVEAQARAALAAAR